MREDVVIAKKSVISSPVGIQNSCSVEAKLMNRIPTASLRDSNVSRDYFFEDAGTSSDVSAEGA